MKGNNMQIKKIKLNFLSSYVMFYDWLETDDIKDYYNVSIYRVNNETLNDFIKNHIMLNDNFSIVNKPIIISDTYSSIAIIFDTNGNSKYKSSLLLNDELHINDDAKNIKLSKFTYIKNTEGYNAIELRQVTHIRTTLKNELNIIESENDKYKLEYFYYKLFNKKCDNFNSMISQIDKKINDTITDEEIYLYDIIQKKYKLV